MNKVKSFADRLVGLLDYLCMALLLVMLVATGYQVFARYILDAPTFWSAELSRYLLVWLTMLGSASLMKEKGGHITVDYVMDRLPPRILSVCLFVRDMFTLLMCALLGYHGATLVEVGGRTSSSGLGVPMSYPYLAIPAGAVIIAIVLLLARNEECVKHRVTVKGPRYGH